MKVNRIRAKIFNMVSTGVIDEPINRFYDAISIIALGLNLFAAFAITFDDAVSLTPSSYKFEQTESLTEKGVAVQPYGALMVPKTNEAISDVITVGVGAETYTSPAVTFANLAIGTEITFQKVTE